MISGVHVKFLGRISSHFYFNQFSKLPQKNWHFTKHKHRFELSYGTCFFPHGRATHLAWDASFKVSLVAWYNDSDSLPPFIVPVCRWLWKNEILIVRSWSHVTPRKFDGWEMYKLLLGMYTQYNSGIDMDNYDSLRMTSFAIFLPSKLLQVCSTSGDGGNHCPVQTLHTQRFTTTTDSWHRCFQDTKKSRRYSWNQPKQLQSVL